jgi:translocation and assembly module TamA
VRGYPYKSLGPEDADGDLIGGHYLTTASIEYAHYFGESWGMAVFSDAGRAFSDGSEPLHVGAGFGFRWRSPVGPLRIDIGFPLDDTEYSTPRLHLSIGPEL